MLIVIGSFEFIIDSKVWAIKSHKYGWDLGILKEDKEGVEQFYARSHFTTMGECVKALYRDKIRELDNVYIDILEIDYFNKLKALVEICNLVSVQINAASSIFGIEIIYDREQAEQRINDLELKYLDTKEKEVYVP